MSKKKLLICSTQGQHAALGSERLPQMAGDGKAVGYIDQHIWLSKYFMSVPHKPRYLSTYFQNGLYFSIYISCIMTP